VHDGSDHVVDLLAAVRASRFADDTMVIVTYDESGGQWDHVPPRQSARATPRWRTWGASSRQGDGRGARLRA
jgi:phospholipase C